MVVGTVIDPEMSEDLRVTVVITGLGESFAESGADATVSSSKNLKSDGTLDLNHLQRPTFIRHQDTETESPAAAEATAEEPTYEGKTDNIEEVTDNAVSEPVKVAALDEEDVSTQDPLSGVRQAGGTTRSQSELSDLYSNDPLTKRDRDLDYLDIPAFLRREED